nr:MAG TPA: hypothetical protein [Bacteriophage sp.]
MLKTRGDILSRQKYLLCQLLERRCCDYENRCP